MVFDVVDGLIAGRTDYWDSLGFLRQVSTDHGRPLATGTG